MTEKKKQMIVTKHAQKRMIERNGLNKKSVERMAERVLTEGISHNETNGTLNKWVTSQYFYNKRANNIKLYGDKAYIFHNSTLITVIPIPNTLKKHVISLQNKKKNK